MKPSPRGVCGCATAVVVVLLCVLGATPVTAGPDESSDVAAMYLHLPLALAGATGPLTTVYHVSNGSIFSMVVTVKCYNEFSVRVGPAGGTVINLIGFQVSPLTPSTLGLTSDPAFTGFGWCHFARTAGNNLSFAVTFVIGVQGTNPPVFGLHPLFASNASLMIGAGTAQANVSNDDATVPLWLGDNWLSVLFILDPTPTPFGNTIVDVYDENGNGSLLNTQTVNVGARGLKVVVLAGGPDGNADIRRASVSGTARGYMAWVYAINKQSLEAFLYDVPLDKDDASLLTAADRP